MPPCQKFQSDFGKKVVLKMKSQKKQFNKKCAPKLLFFNEKNQKDWDDFWLKIHIENPIFTLCDKVES